MPGTPSGSVRVDEVATLFSQLSLSERREALDQIRRHLNPYEWRHLAASLAAKSFRKDIVGDLPVELVTRIFEHLDVVEAFRLQSVSKKWRTVLRSPDVLRPLLKLWFTEHDPPLAGEASCSTEYEKMRLKAEHIQRFRTGNPYQTCSAQVKCCPASGVLVEDFLAYLSSDRRTVEVINLRTGSNMRFSGNGRESLHEIAMSNQLVAFSTYTGHIYVRELSTGNGKHFRITSNMNRHLVCSGRVVACGSMSPNALQGQPEKVDGNAVVYLWNFDTQSGCTVRVPQIGRPFDGQLSTSSPFTFLVDSGSLTITVFSANAPSSDPASPPVGSWLYYSRFSFSGKRIDDSEFWSPSVRLLQPLGWQQSDREGLFVLTTYCKTSSSSPGQCIRKYLFDSCRNQLIDAQKSTFHHCARSETWWKDVCYQVVTSINGQKEGDSIYKTICLGPVYHTLSRREGIPAGFKLISTTSNPLGTTDTVSEKVQLLVNEDFVVTFATPNQRGGWSTLEVGTFDKHLKSLKHHLQNLTAAEHDT